MVQTAEGSRTIRAMYGVRVLGSDGHGNFLLNKKEPTNIVDTVRLSPLIATYEPGKQPQEVAENYVSKRFGPGTILRNFPVEVNRRVKLETDGSIEDHTNLMYVANINQADLLHRARPEGYGLGDLWWADIEQVGQIERFFDYPNLAKILSLLRGSEKGVRPSTEDKRKYLNRVEITPEGNPILETHVSRIRYMVR